jgi:hypothetical protein
MSAIPGGFSLRYTERIKTEELDLSSFKMKSYTYKLHSPYGSPEVDTKELTISSLKAHEDGLGIELIVEGLRSGYVHELDAGGVRSNDGEKPVHKKAYYTLIELAK